ncbi:MAG: glycoside hydrolase family 88/105 protein [Opitutales bacterium]
MRQATNTIKLLAAVLLLVPVAQAEKRPVSPEAESPHGLTHWPEGKSPEEIGLRITNKYLSLPHSHWGKYTKTANRITYPDVCTWLGGLWFAKESNNEALFDRLADRFLPLFGEEKHLHPKPDHVDNNVFGSVPLELYLQGKGSPYLKLGLFYADTQWQVPANAKPEEKAYADKGYTWQTRIWIDDMFMITAVQAQAYRATGDRKYVDRAAQEMVLYLDEIQLENGLFHHSPDAPFAWGRGNGWMAVGMAELLRILPDDNPHKKRIMEGYHKMMAALLKYQAEDGMWRQLIDDEESWKETSGTAMFAYGMITGVKNGWLNEKSYGAAARKGWLALTSYVNEEDNLTEVCDGTNIGDNRDHYMNRPRIVGNLHGQAPVLWCAAALLRN